MAADSQNGNVLEITYVKSWIGYPERQRRTIRALGLRKIHDTVHHADNPTIRGMVRSVQHMVHCRELTEQRADSPADDSAAGERA
jgi:large subunit ribosomal protein L30